MKRLYYVYSEYLKEKYNEKVYKIPINLPVTCPNRDGNISVGGCTFCGDDGTGHENLCAEISVKDQLTQNIEYIGKKYKAKKFISYFQNYSNTYLPIEKFKEYMEDSIAENVVELAISTRPDCISFEHLKILKKIKEKYNVNITIELGLQTANYKSLKKINRGHSLAEFISAMLKIKKYDFTICVHVILNLPWDEMEDVIETSRVITAFGVDFVKLHSLYIVKGTLMEKQLDCGEFSLGTMEDYKERVITFLEYLDENICVQRLIGRAPKNITSFSNWGASWWKIKDDIEEIMHKTNRYQGDKCSYLEIKNNKMWDYKEISVTN